MESKENQTGHFRAGIAAIWSFLQPFRVQFNFLVVLGILSAAANGLVPYVTGKFFDALTKPTATFGSWKLWLVLLIAWVVVQLVATNIDWFSDNIRRRVDTSLQFKLQTDGFTHMFRLPLKYHKNAHTNADLLKVSQASWRIGTILSIATSVAPQFLSMAIGIILATTISPVFSIILCIGVAIYIALLSRILTPIADISHQAHKIWNEGWDDAAAAVQQIESVKQAAAEEYEKIKINKSLGEKARDLWLRLERNWGNVNFLQRTVVFLTQLAIFIIAVEYVTRGMITIGDLVAVNGYALMFFGPIAALGGNWEVVQNGITSAANVAEIFKEPEEDYQPMGAISPVTISGNVSFKDVSFRYAPGQPEVLSNVNFEVKPGQSIALVGESGVGKSTTISLISGYHFPEQGSVLVDGVDTRQFALTPLRKHIAVVPQEVALFNDSIGTNIKYGTFDASDDDMIRVAKEAHIDEFVRTLPEGYKTLVGERGIKLSVGQKQRIAIARAMLRNPAILILDEPTSALDAATEQIVTSALEKLMRGRTTFIVAHRLSTVRKADLILVFDKGRIAERGTHNELIAKPNGIYRKLYEYQIGLH
ncbi:MAG: ABC transporter ATP-binding protein [Patescibacteria group bacterium]|nr:ABC transporter ATP-binding protein [Patescibacteria group bacterium]